MKKLVIVLSALFAMTAFADDHGTENAQQEMNAAAEHPAEKAAAPTKTKTKKMKKEKKMEKKAAEGEAAHQ